MTSDVAAILGDANADLLEQVENHIADITPEILTAKRAGSENTPATASSAVSAPQSQAAAATDSAASTENGSTVTATPQQQVTTVAAEVQQSQPPSQPQQQPQRETQAQPAEAQLYDPDEAGEEYDPLQVDESETSVTEPDGSTVSVFRGTARPRFSVFVGDIPRDCTEVCTGCTSCIHNVE